MYSVYAIKQNIGSYWIGITRTNGIWIKTDGRKLEDTELNLEDIEETGNCMIADSKNDFKPKIVSCTEEYKVKYAVKTHISVFNQIFLSIFVRLDQTVLRDTAGFQAWVELVLKLEMLLEETIHLLMYIQVKIIYDDDSSSLKELIF